MKPDNIPPRRRHGTFRRLHFATPGALGAFLILLAPGGAPAQDDSIPADLLDRLRACRTIDSSEARLDCFDRATRGLQPDVAVTEPAGTAGRDRTAAAPTPEPEPEPRPDPAARPDPEPGRTGSADPAREAAELEAEERRLAAERKRLERERAELEQRQKELAEKSAEAQVIVDPSPADLEAAFGADRMPDYDKPLPKQKLDEVHTRVVELRRDAEGKLVMTMANGQVWTQTQPEFFALDLDQGPVEVVLFRGLFGNYMMRKADSNARLRIRRIR